MGGPSDLPALHAPARAVGEATAPVEAQGWLRPFLRRRLPFVACVVLPTLLAIGYFGYWAADLYASEARIVVRSPAQVQVSGVASILSGIGTGSADVADVHSVREFMMSRDGIEAVSKTLDVREIFNRSEADFASRYPNLVYGDSAEDFYQYFQHRVAVSVDSSSGISTLLVKAFRPEDAQALAEALLVAAEEMVNRLNSRSRLATVQDAELQVSEAEVRVSEAEAALLGYRNREAMLDPSRASGAVFDEITRMESELSAALLKLGQMERTAPNSPFLSELRSNIDALKRQINSKRRELAGSKGSMAPKLSEYGQLLLHQEFATKALTSALTSLEAARAEARQKQVYLERVVDAGLPDEALFPRRFKAIIVVFVSCFLAFSVGRLLIIGVREHGQ